MLRSIAAAAVVVGLAVPAQAAFDHAPLDAIVKKSVKGRFVDYDAVAADQESLKKYLAAVSTAKPAELGGKNDALAFYTNAYNATVLNAVLENGRPKSVLDVKGFFDGKKYTIAGESLTLNELEEKKIRSSGDPRVHFAVNCASYDCPPLMGKAFAGKTWDADLERLTKEFLNRKDEVVVDEAKKEVRVVKLFDWYQKDWGDETKAREFIAKYVPAEVGAKVKDPAYKLAYREYNWANNAKK